MRPFEIVELASVTALRPIEAMQKAVWGVDDLEVVPATAMSAAVHAGGLVVAARAAGDLIGFAYGFVATAHGRGMVGAGLHSHMAAVMPEYRSAGVGRALKRYQAEWCRQRGLGWIDWTFDPLLAKNARFNLSVLGARAHDYLVDVYGPMPGALGGGIDSDRLLAVWPVADVYPADASSADASPEDEPTDDAQVRRVDEPGVDAVDRAPEAWLLMRGPNGGPEIDDSVGAAPGAPLRVAVPAEGHGVFADTALAMAWREAHRATLAKRLDDGYVATGFEDGAYLLVLEDRGRR